MHPEFVSYNNFNTLILHPKMRKFKRFFLLGGQSISHSYQKTHLDYVGLKNVQLVGHTTRSLRGRNEGWLHHTVHRLGRGLKPWGRTPNRGGGGRSHDDHTPRSLQRTHAEVFGITVNTIPESNQILAQ